MQLVVWNSQGNKWDDLYTTGIAPLLGGASPQNVIGLGVEAGWSPWVTPGEVFLGKPYYLNTTLAYYNAAAANSSAFVQGYQAYGTRNCRAFWIPWVANFDALKTNSRCSLGGAYFPVPGRAYSFELSSVDVETMLRPVVRVKIGLLKQTVLNIFLVHLVSSYRAVSELDNLSAIMRTVIDQGSPALIVGDMNINLFKKTVSLSNDWRIVNTGLPTQQKGGELDYGILYDPKGNINVTASVIAQYKTAGNRSDHSMLLYSFPGLA